MTGDRTSRRTALVLGALSVVAAVFNLTKAVHIDDTAYLEVAKGILHHPLHPLSTPLNWGGYAEPAYVRFNQPPLFMYLLAGVLKVFGESEVALHALMAVLSTLGIVQFYRIASRLAPAHALVLTAMLVFSPAFLPGQNLMTDVPLLLMWLVTFGALLDAEAGRGRAYAIAASAAAAACLIKYSSLALIPVLVIVLAVRRQWRHLWTGAIPVLALAAWSIWNYIDYEGVHLVSRPATLQLSDIGTRAVAWVAELGLAAPAVVILAASKGRSGRGAMWLGSAIAAIGVFAAVRTYVPTGPQTAVLWAVFAAAGVAGLWLFLSDTLTLLTLWLVAAGASVVVLAPMMAMRHVLLALPPVLLSIGRGLERRPIRRPALTLGLVATATVGCALAAADYSYASVYRRYSTLIAEGLPQDGSRVWSVGHWGWQWYTGRQGWQPYDQHSTELRVGDTVVAAAVADAQPIIPVHFRQLRAIATYDVPAQGIATIRTYRTDPAGGYYGTFWPVGAFAFSFARTPVETFTVYRVVRP